MDMSDPGMTMGAASPAANQSSSSSASTAIMTSADMAMVFFGAADTPLFSSAWTPSGGGSYAATCVFLVALSVAYRALLALRGVLSERLWRADPWAHKEVMSGDKPELCHGDGGSVLGAARRRWRSRPFHWALEGSRALFEMIVGGVSYLLMLAAMTMNVGYFLSVLGGVFLGTLLVGRFESGNEHH